ncbi:MAG TPA: STAS domain-containing protein [Acidimicrobiales bacterium]|nr:STAS domain-containing protein [Acidimicrobiales bacterium]
MKSDFPESPEGLGIDVGDDRGRTLYRLSGELDALNAARLRTVLTEDADDDRDVVIDLSHLDFIDSSGIGVLVGALKRFEASGRRLVLRSPTPALRRVFDMTGLASAFVIEH